MFIISVVWSPQTFLIDFRKTKGCWKRGKIIIRFRQFWSKNIFSIFFSIFVNFLVLSKSSLIIRFRQFWAKNNFSIFVNFFGVMLKLAHYLLQTMLSQTYFYDFFSRFSSFFCWCNLIIGSLFVSDNSDPRIFFRFFFSIFVNFLV